MAHKVLDDDSSDADRPKTWRFLCGGEIKTVTVPPRLQGQAPPQYHVKTRSGTIRSGSGESIYDVRGYEAGELPPELLELVDKFGETLSWEESNATGRMLRSEGRSVAYDLEDVAAQAKRLEEEAYANAWDRAHLTELHATRARAMKVKVRGKLFKSAEELARLTDELQKDAYRKELALQHRVSDATFKQIAARKRQH